MSTFLAFYRCLIRLCPRLFREEFGPEMEGVVADRLAEAVAWGQLPGVTSPDQAGAAVPGPSGSVGSVPPGSPRRQIRSVFRVVSYLPGILVLSALLLPASWLVHFIPDPPLSAQPFNSLTAYVLFSRASLMLVASAVLLYGALVQRRPAPALIRFSGSGLMLVVGLHSLYWLLIWDSTYDSLGVLWLLIAIFATLLAGAFLAIASPGRLKLAGAVYPLLLAFLMTAVFIYSQRADFRQITEARARHVAQALDTYHERHNRYPETLRQLTPWATLSVREPVIIFGQDWCYEGAADYYRLGYLDREHWSDPRLIGRIAYSVGDAPDGSPICAEQMTALTERYSEYPYTYWKDEAQ